MPEDVRGHAYDYFKALATRDPDLIAPFLDEAIDWLLVGPVELFPWCGHHVGKAAVIEVYRRMASDLTTLAYVPDFLLVDRDCASALTRMSIVQNEDGRTANLRLAQFVRFRDGKVVEACIIMDALSAVEQLLGRALDFAAPPAAPLAPERLPDAAVKAKS